MEVFSSGFFILFLRTFGGALLFPLSFALFPIFLRISVALVLAVALSDIVPLGAKTNELLPSAYVLELILGASIIFPFSLAVKIFLMFGAFVEQGRGQNLGASYGGSVEQEGEGQLGKLLELGAFTLLLSGGFLEGHVKLLLHSVEVLPVGTLYFHTGWREFGVLLFEYCFQSVTLSMLLFLPFGVAFLLSDLALGLVAKLVPGLPIFAEMFVLKSAVTLFSLILIVLPSLPFLVEDGSSVASTFVIATLARLVG